jgi:MOSC domain-containing protein YiiM
VDASGSDAVASGRIVRIHRKPQAAGHRGIPKLAIDRAHVTVEGVEGDYNRHRTEQRRGDPDQAILLLPLEIVRALNDEGWPVAPGDLGENFTTEGVPNEAFAIGQRWRLGHETTGAEVTITRVCEPCRNLAVLPYVGTDNASLKLFVQTLRDRRGWYARVTRPGMVMHGEPVLHLDGGEQASTKAAHP